jgi:hypothetical protein
LQTESIRHAQVEHDLFVAEFAASWVRFGGELLDTDYTLRKQGGDSKIPDLVLRYDRYKVVVEYERLVKKRRELDGAILAAYRSHTVPTIWLSPNAGEIQYLKHAVYTDMMVDKWKLNTSHKWSRSGYQPLLLRFRERQLFIQVPTDVMLRTPEQWLLLIDENARTIRRTALDELMELGWTWTPVSQLEWEGRGLLQFELRIDAMMASATFYVTQMDENTWRVCRADQTPDRGVSMIEKFRWIGKPGDEPPLSVVELATWRIKNYDFHLPD